MQITDLLRQYNNNSTTNAKGVNSSKGVEKLVSSLGELSAGHVFEGTVKYAKNGQVVLALSNGQKVSARMEGKVPLQEGQSMFFQVKSNDGMQIAIRPYTLDGNSVNLTLLNALKAANLPVDGEHLSMVNQMMQEHMSIDKNSLGQMAKVLVANPGVSPETLVQMQKLNLPISPELAAQFEKYMSNNQAIHESMNQFMDVLPTAMSDASLSTEGLKQLNLSLMDMIMEGLPTAGQGENLGQVIAGDISEGAQVIVKADGSVVPNAGEVLPEGAALGQTENLQGESVTNSTGAPAEGAKTLDAIVSDEGAQIQNPTENDKSLMKSVFNQEIGEFLKNAFQGQDSSVASKGEGLLASGKSILTDLFSGNAQEIQGQADGDEAVLNHNRLSDQPPHTLGAILSEKGMENLEKTLLEFSNQSMSLNGDTSTGELLSFVKQILESNQPINKEVLLKLFGGREFSAIIKDALQQQWTITPQELMDDEAVNKLYEKIEHKVSSLEQAVRAAGVENPAVTQAAADVRGNIEFMNQVNQLYTYVQIPLQMSGQTASGELYVYTNKKSMLEGKEELTAFLHLDMDNLGSTDVSIRLKGKELSTNFYLDDDASFELVQAHLPILEARLAAKGYNTNISVNNESKQVNFVEDFLKKDQPSVGQLHRYSFDMRA